MQNNDHKLNPWISIWMQPRATIRMIVETNPERGMLVMIFLGGIAYSLTKAYGNTVGNTIGFYPVLFSSLIAGPISALIFIYLGSFVLKKVGLLFKGQANYVAIRAVIAWAAVPVIATLPLWIIRFAILGKDTFTTAGLSMMKTSPPLWTVNIIALILGIWPYVIIIKGLSEVEKYSVWKALGNVVISFIGVIVILVSLYFLIASIF